jgi:hypothetical protein
MRQIGLASYPDRLSRAAATLLEHQGFDGGWGLTLTSVSSVVNTSEVLAILRAAGVGGKPVRSALSYLSGAVGEHCRPRQKGGRGENTRFVCFGLTGLLRYPEFFTQPGVAETAAWCVDWLDAHQVDHGWPEVAGIDDTSLHQTAVAILALAMLRHILAGLGPDLTLPGGGNTTVLLRRTTPLVSHGLAGLLYHRRSSGAWGWRTYVDTAPSPSKTALCLMAAGAAAGRLSASDPIEPDPGAALEVGGVSGEVQLKRLPEVVAEAAGWLVRNHQRWEAFVEDDKDVQGTAWEHMAYALGVQAVLRGGGNPYDQRLAKAWRLMDDLWDPEAGMWNEPGASGKRATIRAAYSTVCAYEEARSRIGQMNMAERNEGQGDGTELSADRLKVRSVIIKSAQRQIQVSAGGTPVACVLPDRLLTLASILDEAGPGGMALTEIAAALYLAPSSVAKYVQRLNQVVTAAFGGADVKVVIACQTPRGSGYTLAARSASAG